MKNLERVEDIIIGFGVIGELGRNIMFESFIVDIERLEMGR